MHMCNGASIVVVSGGVNRHLVRKCTNMAHACGGEEAAFRSAPA